MSMSTSYNSDLLSQSRVYILEWLQTYCFILFILSFEQIFASTFLIKNLVFYENNAFLFKQTDFIEKALAAYALASNTRKLVKLLIFIEKMHLVGTKKKAPAAYALAPKTENFKSHNIMKTPLSVCWK